MKRLRLACILLFTECVLLILFVGLTVYVPDADASDNHNSIHSVHGGFEPESNTVVKYQKSMIFLTGLWELSVYMS